MAELIFSPKAIEDLQKIKAYIADELGNEQAAVCTVSKILDHIRILADFPESGAPLSSIVDIETNYRFLVCGNYMAFYRYENGKAHIVRVLYGRRNYMQILFGTPDESTCI